ncbi:hypothetical protein [Burkholderia gladioli]|uniref:hypothetical protein n=1 Tax=Burkholderia gladioli TaxID=28095 RepID=UPI00164073EF|nr:hypothetical protein [Burkholderia gladioli]
MSIRVEPGPRRDIAETIGRYFEAREMPFDIEPTTSGGQHVGFDLDGQPASVTISFEARAYEQFEHGDVQHQRAALTRIGQGFAQAFARRGPNAIAADFHVSRF